VRQDQIVSLGELSLQLTHRALKIIQNKRTAGQVQKTMVRNSYVRGGYAPVTPADLPAQRVYTEAFARVCPDIGVLAEEKDPDRPPMSISKKEAVWVVDGLDGSGNFSVGASFGYGTQSALLLSDGHVPIAFVGDAVTGDIFGYYGNSGVFWVNGKNGVRTPISSVLRKKQLNEHVGWHRPTLSQFHPLSQRLLQSGNVGEIHERLGGIGTTMAELLTDKTGIFALRPHHEQPWDAIPAYALSRAAGMVFMTPAKTGRLFTPWSIEHRRDIWKRDFDVLVFHKSRLAQFEQAVASL
jgi:fructose-1,6-bisphosphatase/inositol monophosphatase family enzyme